jgi:hypothetical protein
MTTLSFYRRVIDETGQANRKATKAGTAAVLHALRDRLMPTEAAQAAAQLPRALKDMWRAGDVADRKPIRMDRREFYERIRREGRLGTIREARLLTIGVSPRSRSSCRPARPTTCALSCPAISRTCGRKRDGRFAVPTGRSGRDRDDAQDRADH